MSMLGCSLTHILGHSSGENEESLTASAIKLDSQIDLMGGNDDAIMRCLQKKKFSPLLNHGIYY